MRLALLCSLVLVPAGARAMHIMEGFLPLPWAAAWWLALIPALAWGGYRLRRVTADRPALKIMLAMAGAFTFVLSALKLPSVTGSSSHATGMGLGVVLFGPAPMIVLGTVVLLFQALLLAHGGVTTLGANAWSMAVAGGLAAYGLFHAGLKLRLTLPAAAGLAAAVADLTTYLVAAAQLALAHPSPAGGVPAAFAAFAGVFALTQVPLAVVEGLLTAAVMGVLRKYAAAELRELSVLREDHHA